MNGRKLRVVKTHHEPAKPVKEETPQRTDGVEKINEDFLRDNPYRIETSNHDVTGAVYSPLIYVNNTMLRCSSPYDICIRQIDDAISRYKYNMENDRAEIYRDVCSQDVYPYTYDLRATTTRLITDTYYASITAALEAYFEQTLVQKFTLVDSDTNEAYCPIRDFISTIPRSSMGCAISYAVNGWWNIYNDNISPADKSRAAEEQIQMMLYGISRALADSLCELAREISFGEPKYMGNDRDAFIDSYIRDIYIAEAATEVGVDITPQDFYGVQMSEYMCILDGAMPIVEVLVRQCYETFKYLYFRLDEASLK